MFTFFFTIQGLFDPDAPHPKLPHSPLYKPLMDTSIMPAGFIVDLITMTSNHGWEEFKTVFSPLITCLGKTTCLKEIGPVHHIAVIFNFTKKKIQVIIGFFFVK